MDDAEEYIILSKDEYERMFNNRVLSENSITNTTPNTEKNSNIEHVPKDMDNTNSEINSVSENQVVLDETSKDTSDNEGSNSDDASSIGSSKGTNESLYDPCSILQSYTEEQLEWIRPILGYFYGNGSKLSFNDVNGEIQCSGKFIRNSNINKVLDMTINGNGTIGKKEFFTTLGDLKVPPNLIKHKPTRRYYMKLLGNETEIVKMNSNKVQGQKRNKIETLDNCESPVKKVKKQQNVVLNSTNKPLFVRDLFSKWMKV